MADLDLEKYDIKILNALKLTADHVVFLGVDISGLPVNGIYEALQKIGKNAGDAFAPARIIVHDKNYAIRVRDVRKVFENLDEDHVFLDEDE